MDVLDELQTCNETDAKHWNIETFQKAAEGRLVN